MMKRNKAFTLIEIVVVLIILGALAAIAIPSYFSWVSKSRLTAGLQDIASMKNELLACTIAKGNDYAALQICITPVADKYNIANPSAFYSFAIGAGSSGSDWQYFYIALVGTDPSINTTITFYKNGTSQCTSHAGVC